MTKISTTQIMLVLISIQPHITFGLYVGDTCVDEIAGGITDAECEQLKKYVKGDTMIGASDNGEAPQNSCAKALKLITHSGTYASKSKAAIRAWLKSKNKTSLAGCLDYHFPDFKNIDYDYEENYEEKKWRPVDTTVMDYSIYGFICFLATMAILKQIHFVRCMDEELSEQTEKNLYEHSLSSQCTNEKFHKWDSSPAPSSREKDA